MVDESEAVQSAFGRWVAGVHLRSRVVAAANDELVRQLAEALLTL